MTFPLRSSPRFASTSQQTLPQTSIQETRIKELSKLIQNLLKFSLGGTSSSIEESDALLASSNLETIEGLSAQLRDIQKDTAKSCDEIAKSILDNRLSLTSCLQSNQVLSSGDMNSIKQTLVTPSLLQQQRKRPASEDTASKLEEKLLPLKKRKSYREACALPESTPQPSPDADEQCSLQTLRTIFTIFAADKKERASYLCPLHTPSSSCHDCTPIKKIIQDLDQCKTGVTLLAHQIRILLQFTSLELLTQAIFKHKKILAEILQGKYLQNHILAILCLECDISDDICIDNNDNPKSQAVLYSHMYSLTSKGSRSPFVLQIKKLWETATIPQKSAVNSLKICKTPDGKICQEISQSAFAESIPKIQRSFPFLSKNRLTTYYANRKITGGFAKFLTQTVFKTAIVIQGTPTLHHLLTTTPEGEKLPSGNLLIRILALALCCNNEWSVRILPCKASIVHKQFCRFNKEFTRRMHNALSGFNSRNLIYLQGKNQH